MKRTHGKIINHTLMTQWSKGFMPRYAIERSGVRRKESLISDALNDYDELFSALTAKRKSVSIPEIPSAKKV